MTMHPPDIVLCTARLRLRRFTADDAAFVVALVNSPGWLRYIGDRHVHTEAEGRDWLKLRIINHYAARGYGFWAIEPLQGGPCIGLCGLILRDGLDAPDLGYALLPEHEGRGYAREAAAACLQHGHQGLNMPRILAITDPQNTRSAQLLLDLGMRETGTVRLPGGTADLRLFSSVQRADEALQKMTKLR